MLREKVLAKGEWGSSVVGIITTVANVFFDGFIYPEDSWSTGGQCFRICVEKDFLQGNGVLCEILQTTMRANSFE